MKNAFQPLFRSSRTGSPRIPRRAALFALASLALLPLAGPGAAQTPSTPVGSRLPGPAPARDSLTLTLLHTNDLHGHVLPFSYIETGRSPIEKDSVGGAARRATLIRDIRKRSKSPVMVLDIGDIGTRGPLTSAYEGVADIEALNAVGYELGVVGNNEFKFKDGVARKDAAGAQAALLAVLRRSHFPWVCANAGVETKTASGEIVRTLLPGVLPFVVREFDGVRVGFLGLTAPRSAFYPQVAGWWVSDPVDAAKEWIPKVRRECDILIAVTHVGIDDDKRLASATVGIDAIVGGDSHTFLYKPETVKNADGSKLVPIVQTGEFGVNLGKFDLHLKKTDSGWALSRYDYALLPIDSRLREAPDVAAVANRYAAPLKAPVGKLPEKYLGKTPEERTRLSTLALCDALARETGADFALCPAGGGFFDVFRRPDVTAYDIRAALPFDNVASIATLTGTEVSALIALQKTTVSSLIGPLEPNRTYKVAFVDFVATDSYKLAPEKLTSTGRDIRELFAAWLVGGAKVMTP